MRRWHDRLQAIWPVGSSRTDQGAHSLMFISLQPLYRLLRMRAQMKAKKSGYKTVGRRIVAGSDIVLKICKNPEIPILGFIMTFSGVTPILFTR